MGTLKRSELEAEVRANLGGRTDLDSRLVRLLNIAQTQIARYYPWPELRELSTNNTPYTGTDSDKFLALPNVPRDIISIRLIDGTRSRKLIYVPPRKWDKVIPKPEQSTRGRPTHYTVWREVLEFWRVPDAVYELQLRWVKNPTDFTSSSDTVSDLEDKDDIIIAIATAWSYFSLGDFERYQRWMRLGYDLLKTAVQRDDQPFTDYEIQAEYRSDALIVGDYWLNPFVKEMP